MNRKLPLIALFLICLFPALAMGAKEISPQNEIERLTREYQACRQEAQVVINERKPLPEYFALVSKIERLEEELEALGIVLAKDSKIDTLPPFKIKAYFNRVGENPLTGYASNGDIVAFGAAIEYPDFGGAPRATELFWQLYDSNNRPVEGVAKREKQLESAVIKDHTFRFQINDLSPGIYTVGLTHYLLDDPEVFSQQSFPFKLFDAASIDKIVVTDNPADLSNHKSFITNDKLPHIYMFYKLAQGVMSASTTITVTDAETNDFIISMTREIPADKQRFGIRLEKGTFKPVQSFKVVAEIKTPDSKTKNMQNNFAVGHYRARLNLPGQLQSGKAASFRIDVPDQFTPPFQVSLNPSNGLVLSHGANALTGTVTGIAPDYDLPASLSMTVTDSAGLIAKGTASLLIKARKKTQDNIGKNRDETALGTCADEQRTLNQAELFTPGIVKMKPLNCDAVEWKTIGREGSNYFTRYQVKRATDIKHGQLLHYATDHLGTTRLFREYWYLNGKLNGPKYNYSMYAGKIVMNGVAEYKNDRLHGKYWVFTSDGVLNKQGSCFEGICN